MWYLWSLITLVVILFSTSQLMAYIVCFVRHPKLLVTMSVRNKRLFLGGLILHIVINLTWFSIICFVPAIRRYDYAIFPAAVIGFLLSLYGLKNFLVPMFLHFCQPTDKDSSPQNHPAEQHRDEQNAYIRRMEHRTEPLAEQDACTKKLHPDTLTDSDHTDGADADTPQDPTLSDTE